MTFSVRGEDNSHLGAAVAMVGSKNLSDDVVGVVRIIQVNHDLCVLEGTIDGLKHGEHYLRVHTLGDLSRGCDR